MRDAYQYTTGTTCPAISPDWAKEREQQNVKTRKEKATNKKTNKQTNKPTENKASCAPRRCDRISPSGDNLTPVSLTALFFRAHQYSS